MTTAEIKPVGRPVNEDIKHRKNAGTETVGPDDLKARPAIGKDHDGLKAALEYLHIEVRHNERKHREEYRREGLPESDKVAPLPLNKWVHRDERTDAAIRSAILDTFRFHTGSAAKWGKEAFEEHLNSIVFGKMVDPFKEWLEALDPWDSSPRLERIWEDALGVEGGNLEYSTSRFLIAAVGRTFSPGYWHDYVPVLVGAQGTGKSTFCRELVPYGQDWFRDGLDLSADPKVLEEATMGSVVVEFSELVGVRKTDIEKLKTYLSQRQTTLRLSYRRDSGTYDRSWVALGTANDGGNGVLPEDRSGHRRFVIIDIPPTSTPQRVKEYLEEERHQLWAEALARFKAGEKTHLNPEDEAAASLKATSYVIHNAAVEDAAALLTEKANGTAKSMTQLLLEGQLCNSVAEAATKLGLQRSLSGVLLDMGWEKARPMVDGRRKWLWTAPPT